MFRNVAMQGVTEMVDGQSAARDLVERLVDAYNAKDMETIASLYRTDARYWSALDGWQEGRIAILSHIEELHRQLPDEAMAIKALMTDGEAVVVEFVSTGTNPAGRAYELEFTEVIDLVDGRIARVKVYLDPDEVARTIS